MTNLIHTQKLLSHLQQRIELISSLAETDEHFEEVEKELRVLRSEIVAGKFDPLIWG